MKYPLSLIALLFVAACAKEQETPPPEAFIKMPDDGFEVNLGDTLLIQPKITWDYDTHYEWYENSQLISTERDYEYIADTLKTNYYHFKVISDRGSDTLNITVHSMNIIHFDDFKFTTEKDTFWNASAGETGFYSSQVFFPTQYISDLSWDGFACSNKTDKSEKDKYRMYCSMPAIGVDKSKNYAVFHQGTNEHLNRIALNGNFRFRPSSIQITNTVYNYYIIKNGDGQGHSMGQGDLFTFIVTGYDAEGQPTGTVQYNLADNTSTNKNNWKVNQSWTQLDLETLGYVYQIGFQLVTTSQTIDIPRYVCIDDLKIRD